MPAVQISLGTYIKAGGITSRFNIVSKRAHGKKRVRTVLENSIHVALQIARLVKNGWTFSMGNAWAGDEEIYDLNEAQKIARNEPKKTVFYQVEDTKNFGLSHILPPSVQLDDKKFEQFQDLKRIFGLSSDIETARLLVSTYDYMLEHKYRTWGFYLEDPKTKGYIPLEF